jgi:hypothetical protein
MKDLAIIVCCIVIVVLTGAVIPFLITSAIAVVIFALIVFVPGLEEKINKFWNGKR